VEQHKKTAIGADVEIEQERAGLDQNAGAGKAALPLLPLRAPRRPSLAAQTLAVWERLIRMHDCHVTVLLAVSGAAQIGDACLILAPGEAIGPISVQRWLTAGSSTPPKRGTAWLSTPAQKGPTLPGCGWPPEAGLDVRCSLQCRGFCCAGCAYIERRLLGQGAAQVGLWRCWAGRGLRGVGQVWKSAGAWQREGGEWVGERERL